MPNPEQPHDDATNLRKLEQQRKKFAELTMGIPETWKESNQDLSQRLHEIPMKAEPPLNRLIELLNQPGADDEREGFAQQVRALYARAVQIKTAMFRNDLVARRMLGTHEDSLHEEFDERLDRHFPPRIEPGQKRDEIAVKILEIAHNLDPDPVAKGNTKNHRYYTQVGAELAVNVRHVRQDIGWLDEHFSKRPEIAVTFNKDQHAVARDLRSSLEQMSSIDTQSYTISAQQQALDPLRDNTNYDAARKLAGMGLGLIGGLGLIVSLIKGKVPTWPTYAYLALAVWGYNPDWLKGSAELARINASFMATDTVNGLVKAGLTADIAEEIFALQKLDAANKMREYLKKNGMYTTAQLEGLLGTDHPLVNQLKDFSDPDRAKALRVFLTNAKDPETQVLALQMLRAHPSVGNVQVSPNPQAFVRGPGQRVTAN